MNNVTGDRILEVEHPTLEESPTRLTSPTRRSGLTCLTS